MAQTHAEIRHRRTGRPKVEPGRYRDGPSLPLDPDGPAAVRLRDASHSLASNPAGKTWATLLERPDEGDADRPRLLQWLAPGSASPPAHLHPTTEQFTGVEGTLTVVRDGEPAAVDPGETVTVAAGVAHTFRNDTDGVVAFEAELPSMQTVASLYTAWGRSHERAGPEGEFEPPGLLEGLVLSADVAPETTMTMAPMSVQRALWATLGSAARITGYEGIDRSYLADDFWRRHVEQPSLSPRD
ncbi:cupin domain-containing protein [Halobacteriales archaeon Cl-PHB]